MPNIYSDKIQEIKKLLDDISNEKQLKNNIETLLNGIDKLEQNEIDTKEKSEISRITTTLDKLSIDLDKMNPHIDEVRATYQSLRIAIRDHWPDLDPSPVSSTKSSPEPSPTSIRRTPSSSNVSPSSSLALAAAGNAQSEPESSSNAAPAFMFEAGANALAFLKQTQAAKNKQPEAAPSAPDEADSSRSLPESSKKQVSEDQQPAAAPALGEAGSSSSPSKPLISSIDKELNEQAHVTTYPVKTATVKLEQTTEALQDVLKHAKREIDDLETAYNNKQKIDDKLASAEKAISDLNTHLRKTQTAIENTSSTVKSIQKDSKLLPDNINLKTANGMVAESQQTLTSADEESIKLIEQLEKIQTALEEQERQRLEEEQQKALAIAHAEKEALTATHAVHDAIREAHQRVRLLETEKNLDPLLANIEKIKETAPTILTLGENADEAAQHPNLPDGEIKNNAIHASQEANDAYGQILLELQTHGWPRALTMAYDSANTATEKADTAAEALETLDVSKIDNIELLKTNAQQTIEEAHLAAKNADLVNDTCFPSHDTKISIAEVAQNANTAAERVQQALDNLPRLIEALTSDNEEENQRLKEELERQRLEEAKQRALEEENRGLAEIEKEINREVEAAKETLGEALTNLSARTAQAKQAEARLDRALSDDLNNEKEQKRLEELITEGHNQIISVKTTIEVVKQAKENPYLKEDEYSDKHLSRATDAINKLNNTIPKAKQHLAKAKQKEIDTIALKANEAASEAKKYATLAEKNAEASRKVAMTTSNKTVKQATELANQFAEQANQHAKKAETHHQAATKAKTAIEANKELEATNKEKDAANKAVEKAIEAAKIVREANQHQINKNAHLIKQIAAQVTRAQKANEQAKVTMSQLSSSSSDADINNAITSLNKAVTATETHLEGAKAVMNTAKPKILEGMLQEATEAASQAEIDAAILESKAQGISRPTTSAQDSFTRSKDDEVIARERTIAQAIHNAKNSAHDFAFAKAQHKLNPQPNTTKDLLTEAQQAHQIVAQQVAIVQDPNQSLVTVNQAANEIEEQADIIKQKTQDISRATAEQQAKKLQQQQTAHEKALRDAERAAEQAHQQTIKEVQAKIEALNKAAAIQKAKDAYDTAYIGYTVIDELLGSEHDLTKQAKTHTENTKQQYELARKDEATVSDAQHAASQAMQHANEVSKLLAVAKQVDDKNRALMTPRFSGAYFKTLHASERADAALRRTKDILGDEAEETKTIQNLADAAYVELVKVNSDSLSPSEEQAAVTAAENYAIQAAQIADDVLQQHLQELGRMLPAQAEEPSQAAEEKIREAAEKAQREAEQLFLQQKIDESQQAVVEAEKAATAARAHAKSATGFVNAHPDDQTIKKMADAVQTSADKAAEHLNNVKQHHEAVIQATTPQESCTAIRKTLNESILARQTAQQAKQQNEQIAQHLLNKLEGQADENAAEEARLPAAPQPPILTEEEKQRALKEALNAKTAAAIQAIANTNTAIRQAEQTTKPIKEAYSKLDEINVPEALAQAIKTAQQALDNHRASAIAARDAALVAEKQVIKTAADLPHNDIKTRAEKAAKNANISAQNVDTIIKNAEIYIQNATKKLDRMQQLVEKQESLARELQARLEAEEQARQKDAAKRKASAVTNELLGKGKEKDSVELSRPAGSLTGQKVGAGSSSSPPTPITDTGSPSSTPADIPGKGLDSSSSVKFTRPPAPSSDISSGSGANAQPDQGLGSPGVPISSKETIDLSEIQTALENYDNYLARLSNQLTTLKTGIDHGNALYALEVITPDIARKQADIQARLNAQIKAVTKIDKESAVIKDKLAEINTTLSQIISADTVYEQVSRETAQTLLDTSDKVAEAASDILNNKIPFVLTKAKELTTQINKSHTTRATDHITVTHYAKDGEHGSQFIISPDPIDNEGRKEINAGLGGKNKNLFYEQGQIESEDGTKKSYLSCKTNADLSKEERTLLAMNMVLHYDKMQKVNASKSPANSDDKLAIGAAANPEKNNEDKSQAINKDNPLPLACTDEYALIQAILIAKTQGIPAEHILAGVLTGDVKQPVIPYSTDDIQNIYDQASANNDNEIKQRYNQEIKPILRAHGIEIVNASGSTTKYNAYTPRDVRSEFAKTHKHPDQQNYFYSNDMAAAGGKLFSTPRAEPKAKPPTFNMSTDDVKKINEEATHAVEHVTRRMSK
jgi:hypothetical protein